MKIVKAETIRMKIPFQDPGEGGGLFPGSWKALDFVLLRVETDSGLVGWGEGFSYFCATATKAMIDETVIPTLIGRDISERDAIMTELRHKLHILGRYGISIFAISAADIVLHDLAAKAEGVSLATYLGGRKREDLPAYASLIRYGDAAMAADVASAAAAEGYGMIKLHEIELEPVLAVRRAIGPDIELTDDVNCNWTVQQTLDWAPALREEARLLWLEEPIFPPEDFATLARLRAETGLAIATGENLSTWHQFDALIQAGGADYVQPSLTKIGGFDDTMETHRRAQAAGVKVAHHAPYFGPGLLATLQVLGTVPDEGWLEWLYVGREASLFPSMAEPKDGRIAIPDGPGLGWDPDPDVMARYAV